MFSLYYVQVGRSVLVHCPVMGILVVMVDCVSFVVHILYSYFNYIQWVYFNNCMTLQYVITLLYLQNYIPKSEILCIP